LDASVVDELVATFQKEHPIVLEVISLSTSQDETLFSS
jgi:hypothetical protein